MSDETPNERGMPIYKATLCVVGTHTFITTGASKTTMPKPAQVCDCGLFQHRDLHPSEKAS